MSEKAFPRKYSVGAQLGIGVKSAALYNPSKGKIENSEYGWTEAYDDQLAIDLSKLRISADRCMVDGLSRTIQTDEVIDDGYFVDDEDDEESYEDSEADEHWKEILLSRLSWESLSPVIPRNFQYFKEVELNREYMYDIKSKLNSPHDFVPGNLITDLSRSDLISSGQAGTQLKTKGATSYDPTVGPLFITGEIQTIPDLRNNIQPRRILVYSSGKANSLLNIAVADEKRNDKENVSFDQIRSSCCVEMASAIKSVKISNLSGMLGRKSDLIGVMTESDLHMIKIENISSHHDIKISMCEPLPFKHFGDFPFADFAFNPWDLRQFAVVDVKGNFGLCQMPKSFKAGGRCQVSKDNFGTIFDPEELSNWRRIEWSSSFTRLLVMDRSKLIELDLAHDWELEIIQAKTWSRLLDYHRLDDDYGILLTSREIILISTKQSNEHLTREISWKHDLNPEDTTLRLCVQAIKPGGNNLLLACIFSRNHSQIYVQCFSLNDRKTSIKLGGSPVLLQVPHVTAGLKGVCLYDRSVDDAVEISAVNSQPSMQLSMFISETESRTFWHYIVTSGDLPINQNVGLNSKFSNSRVVCQKDESYFPRNVPSLVTRVHQATRLIANPERNATPESEMFQTYGYQLSEAINKLLPTWADSEKSLAQLQSPIRHLATVPNDIHNLSEFTSLLQQLSQHYTDQGLMFTSFKTISSLLLREAAEDLDIFYSKLLQCWDLVTTNSEALTRCVIRDAVMSTLHFWKPSLYSAVEEKLRESLSGSHREIVDSWTEEDLPTTMTQESSATFDQSQLFQGSQSQIPTIKASQARSSKRTKRTAAGLTSGKVLKVAYSQPLFNKENMAAPPLLSATHLPSTLPETMTPAFSLMQPAGSFSQSQSSQRSKRKKKVGGFG
ncbi:hypothetical protein HG536_0D04630 [Torulaspora globosa]|uniref:RNA polymerase I-specific transcription initiation factor RRN6 n=1 Tax=Torulaspora globosa TaxID=48254 RepID=A0A7G3ZHF5_9SACH|nr:uncharacterized protein HG536_0D04630 [Torulaspora globosa]QLL32941.1 hypothetical protein HG536_0D04630 [Torulaspora globosa]